MGSAILFKNSLLNARKYSLMTLYLYYLIIGPRWRMGDARNFKNWLLNAWKCTQMTLYLYYLIIGAPGGGWIVPALLKVGF